MNHFDANRIGAPFCFIMKLAITHKNKGRFQPAELLQRFKLVDHRFCLLKVIEPARLAFNNAEPALMHEGDINFVFHLVLDDEVGLRAQVHGGELAADVAL